MPVKKEDWVEKTFIVYLYEIPHEAPKKHV